MPELSKAFIRRIWETKDQAREDLKAWKKDYRM